MQASAVFAGESPLRRRPLHFAAAATAFAAVMSVPLHSAQNPTATNLLDQYLRGEFGTVVAQLERMRDFGDLLDELKRDGPAWIDAAPPEVRPRRTLAAATVALEAARLGAWTEWKIRTRVPDYLKAAGELPPELLEWRPPPLLIEWGCLMFRRDGAKAGPLERWWQLAALAVAQRAEDFEFLRSDGVTNIYNPEVEIDHLFHTRVRFPDEPRLMLAEGTVAEWRRPRPAIEIFEELEKHPDVSGEAMMRMGAIYFRQRDDDRAIVTLERVEPKTRDPWVIYLARYFKGQALERKRRLADAERAYRGALAAVPAAQSASVALATLLFRQDRRTEAAGLMAAMFAKRPPVADPWRGYAHADDRFWPYLLARIRAEIRP